MSLILGMICLSIVGYSDYHIDFVGDIHPGTWDECHISIWGELGLDELTKIGEAVIYSGTDSYRICCPIICGPTSSGDPSGRADYYEPFQIRVYFVRNNSSSFVTTYSNIYWPNNFMYSVSFGDWFHRQNI